MSAYEPPGPDFRPPPAPPSVGAETAVGSGRRPVVYAPPPNRGPLLISLGVIALVLAVVAAATVYAHRADREQAGSATSAPASPGPLTPTGASSSSLAALGIDFVTPDGTGRLSVLAHRWRTDSAQPALLVLDIQLSCATGVVDYDPFTFQTFDEIGNVYDGTPELADHSLGVGTLRPGQAVRGQLSFVMPRGDVTLLMGDPSQTVTALRIPD